MLLEIRCALAGWREFGKGRERERERERECAHISWDLRDASDVRSENAPDLMYLMLL